MRRPPGILFQDIDFAATFGEWCNGSTTDSDSVCLGSNPSSPAILPFGVVRIEPQTFDKPLIVEANISLDARLRRERSLVAVNFDGIFDGISRL